ncbi:hypothetical protein JYB64_04350 [Algoriphagus aestuarii]|nr:hypothetical protein [Algoriphagus aestuarii]
MDLSRIKEYGKSKWYVRVPLMAISSTLLYLMMVHRSFNLVGIPLGDFIFESVKWFIFASVMDFFFFYRKKPKNEA